MHEVCDWPTAADLIRAIQGAYPGAIVNVGVLQEFVSVSVSRLPVDVFPERSTSEYPNGTYVVHDTDGLRAAVTSFRYADKDVDAALDAAWQVVSGVSALIETDWNGRAESAECRLRELEAEVAASTAVDLLGRYRRACIENDALKRRVAELESRAATAGAAVEALTDGDEEDGL